VAYEVLAKLTGETPPTTRAQARMVGRFYWYSHDRAARFGFVPRPARQALAEALAWLVASPHVSKGLRRQIQLSPEVHEARGSLPPAISLGAPR
jgi:dihydroflavonol-4-reductase